MIDILSTFYVKFTKLLGPLPFRHTSQHMFWHSSHSGMSYVFRNQTHVSSADEALCNVAPGSTALDVLRLAAACSVGPSLKINSKFKVRKLTVVYQF
jgi:hypothetical protein